MDHYLAERRRKNYYGRQQNLEVNLRQRIAELEAELLKRSKAITELDKALNECRAEVERLEKRADKFMEEEAKQSNKVMQLRSALEKAELEICTCPWPEDAIHTRHLLDCKTVKLNIDKLGRVFK